MCETMTATNYIYLLHVREFIKSKENVYKVGMTTKKNFERFNQYPKGSDLLFQMRCNDCRIVETLILKKFMNTFKQRREYGNEYFEGDYKDMIDIIYLTIKDENNNCVIEDTLETYEGKNDVKKPVYQIETYAEWIIYNNVISKVIITNRKREEGFLRFKGQLWRKLYHRNNDNDYEEHLLGFIQNYQESLLFKNTITNEMISHRDYLSLNDTEKNNYDHNSIITVEYNDEEILKDALKNCYVKECDFYKLNYYEYVFHINQPLSSSSYVIFNSINTTFTPVDELISDKILTGKESGARRFYAKNIINTNIVDDILKSLIPNNIIIRYKKLTYNLIVKQGEFPIIFYDYNDCLLTTWIKDLLFSISDDKFFVSSLEYYDDKIGFRKLMKTHKYRCVIIRAVKNKTIENQIKDFCNLGFKNIIACQDDTRKTMYDISSFRKYLHNNKEILMKYIKEENNYVIDDWESEIQYDDSIFYMENLLLTNFLKWCCMK